MNKVMLLDYQLKALKSFLSWTYEQVESEVLKEYGVMMIEDLPSTKFDEIMELAQESHREIQSKYDPRG